MHYTTNGTEATDRTTVGVIFAKEPPTQDRAPAAWRCNPRFVIPAGDGNAEVNGATHADQQRHAHHQR